MVESQEQKVGQDSVREIIGNPGDEHMSAARSETVDGRVIGGMGVVGFVEHAGVTDIQVFLDEINTKYAALASSANAPQPDNPRSNLYTFIKI